MVSALFFYLCVWLLVGRYIIIQSWIVFRVPADTPQVSPGKVFQSTLPIQVRTPPHTTQGRWIKALSHLGHVKPSTYSTISVGAVIATSRVPIVDGPLRSMVCVGHKTTMTLWLSPGWSRNWGKVVVVACHSRPYAHTSYLSPTLTSAWISIRSPLE